MAEQAPAEVVPIRPNAVTVTIDGKTVEASEGELLIAVAERHGVYIPRFCWHPRMRPVGMCRMCLVDIEGPRGWALLPACMQTVTDGMNVDTQNERVRKVQDGVLEFLLINHPLDCPVCDRGGECPLQDQTVAFGPGESRFVEEKRHFEKPIPISELVLLDRERCIQCARCTRFAEEIAGEPLIQFVERGNQIQVLTFPDQPFRSYFSGNTVQICPVGALTAKPYRFRARPWDLEQTESTCTSCAVGCRVLVQSSSDRITRKLGIDSDPVNQGWLCDKGRFDYEAFQSERRLVAPLVRDGDGLAETTWGEALARAAAGIRRALDDHGPGAVGFIGGARLPNEDAYAWAKLARAVVGTDNVDCQLGDGLPAEVLVGLPRATIDEACSAGAVVLLAPDLREELPVLYLRLRQAAVERGLPLIEITPAATSLSRHAAVRLTYRPGEVALLARALVTDTQGDVAGVAAGEIEAARRLLERAGDVVVVAGRPSLTESAASVAEAVVSLAGLPGARFLPALRRANVHGAIDMGLAPGMLPGRTSLDAGREWFTAAWGRLPAAAGLDTAGMLAAAADGRLRALVLVGADPLSDFPDRALAARALAAASFVVAVDLFVTPSARHADVVLAAAGWGERAGTTTNLEGRVSRLSQKVTAPGTSRPDWMIASELAWRLGGDLGFETIDDIWAEIERLAPAHAGLTAALLARPEYRDGIVVPLRGAPPRAVGVLPDEALAATEEATPTPAVTGASGAAAAGAAVARPPLLTLRTAPAAAAVPPVDSYSLRLVAGRTLYDAGTLVQEAPSLAGLAPPVRLRANPYDLGRLGVGTGDRVRVTSPVRSMVVEVVADDGVPRGSAWLAFNPTGEGAADLIDSSGPVTDIRVETLA
jgi:NADH-quinone oxidoreductase subunit G